MLPDILMILSGALILGMAHAFEPDHLAAVSAFVAQRPQPGKALFFGLKWAVGHGASLLAMGTVLYFLKLAVSVSVAGWLERAVGAALVGLGAWTLVKLRPASLHHTHTHTHVVNEIIRSDSTDDRRPLHAHTHADGTTHSHAQDHGSLWMGFLHGAAGTAAFVGGTLVALAKSYTMVLAYTLAFSIGVLLAMGLYAGALGGVLAWGVRKSHRFLVVSRAAAGAWAFAVGIYWLFK